MSTKIIKVLSCALLTIAVFASCSDDKKNTNHEGSDILPIDSELITEDDEEDESQTSTGGYDNYPNNDYTPYPTPTPEPIQSPTPRRDQCRACNGTGNCPVCNGNCQTHTKRVYNYSLGCYDLEWESCQTCGGSGRHAACGGDGWLDEGVDF